MKFRATLVLVLLLLGWTGVSPETHGQRQKPVHVIEVHLDGGPAEPRTFDALQILSDLIVEGTVESTRSADINIDMPEIDRYETLVFTAFKVRVFEIFASRLRSTPEVIEVILPVGRRERSDRIEETRANKVRELKEGHRYILFLKQDDELSGFVPATGGDSSIVEARNGKLEPRFAESPVAGYARSGQLRAILRKGRGR